METQLRTGPPAETGERLATLERGPDDQLRVNWCEYNGSHYLSLRMWKRDFQGRWWPSREKGLTIRIRELDQVAAAIAAASSLAEALPSRQPAHHARPHAEAVRSMPPARRRTSAVYNRPSPPACSTSGDEFNES